MLGGGRASRRLRPVGGVGPGAVRSRSTPGRLRAFRPEAAKPDRQGPVRATEPGMRGGAQRDLERMAEDKAFENQIPTRSTGSDKRYEAQARVVRHPPGLHLPQRGEFAESNGLLLADSRKQGGCLPCSTLPSGLGRTDVGRSDSSLIRVAAAQGHMAILIQPAALYQCSGPRTLLRTGHLRGGRAVELRHQ